jgi:hypothetical protein
VSAFGELTTLKCPFCRSALVRVVQQGIDDRLICPICWAWGSDQPGAPEEPRLQRGTHISKEVRLLVDKARFPHRWKSRQADTVSLGTEPLSTASSAPQSDVASGAKKTDPA